MTVRVEHGDSRDVIRTLADASIDSCVCDPPYALVSIVKRFGKPGSTPAQEGADGRYRRASAGFMGKQWDTGETAFDPEFWVDVLRVMKPGGHLIAFGGTRSYHRLACAIEDAGFEIRDAIMWHYGSGFPKSHNVSNKIDRCACGPEAPAESHPVNSVRQLRKANSHPAVTSTPEPECVLRPLLSSKAHDGAHSSSACAQRQSRLDRGEHGELPEENDGAEESSLEGRGDLSEAARQLRQCPLSAVPSGTDFNGSGRRLRDGASAGDGEVDRPAAAENRGSASRRSQSAKQSGPEEFGAVAGQSESQALGAWPLCRGCGKPLIPDGLGTALKPATEIIVLARKPLAGTVASNVLQHGTGALNIDGCRIPTDDNLNGGTYTGELRDPGPQRCLENQNRKRGIGEFQQPDGRWPANVIHDGSEEVLAAFPETNGQGGGVRGDEPSQCHSGVYSGPRDRLPFPNRGDTGSAARFFYSAKADAGDRLGSKHPTVKPVDLMAYLCRLVTPPGGTVLDPFAGSGTTGMACLREGFDCILIEREAEYVTDIRRRLAHVEGADTPLFSAERQQADLLP
jgi:DNA modification methylase